MGKDSTYFQSAFGGTPESDHRNSACGQPLVEDYVNGNDRSGMLNAFSLASPFYLGQGDLRYSQLKNILLSHV
jgi:hypothetical protein